MHFWPRSSGAGSCSGQQHRGASSRLISPSACFLFYVEFVSSPWLWLFGPGMVMTVISTDFRIPILVSAPQCLAHMQAAGQRLCLCEEERGVVKKRDEKQREKALSKCCYPFLYVCLHRVVVGCVLKQLAARAVSPGKAGRRMWIVPCQDRGVWVWLPTGSISSKPCFSTKATSLILQKHWSVLVLYSLPKAKNCTGFSPAARGYCVPHPPPKLEDAQLQKPCLSLGVTQPWARFGLYTRAINQNKS